MPLATILKNRDIFAGKRVGVIITGGNVDLDKLPWLKSNGGDTMTKYEKIDELEVGYDIPAAIGMAYEDIQTPCLILDLDALERNVKKMGDYARAHNMRHRAHGKMHKSVDVLKLQMEQGGAIGVCCQKVSEAEVFARAGIKDILVSNEVRDPAKIDLLARMPKHGGRVIVCVDDVANVADLSKAAQKHGTDARRLRRDRLRRRPLRRHHHRGRGRDRQGRRRRARPALPRHPGLPGRDAAHRRLRGPQGQARRRHRPGQATPSRR